MEWFIVWIDCNPGEACRCSVPESGYLSAAGLLTDARSAAHLDTESLAQAFGDCWVRSHCGSRVGEPFRVERREGAPADWLTARMAYDSAVVLGLLAQKRQTLCRLSQP